jgi:hypothetical protein
MSETQSRMTTEGTRSRLTRPILFAGLLGGLLGGVTSFAADRLIKPATPTPAPTAKEKATEEARHIVEEFLALLKAEKEKKDEFMKQVKNGYTFMNDDLYKRYKQDFDTARSFVYPGYFGTPLYEFELLRETALSPDLIQFVYLEKFDHGAVIWRFVMYRGKESWRVANLIWSHEGRDAFVP